MELNVIKIKNRDKLSLNSNEAKWKKNIYTFSDYVENNFSLARKLSITFCKYSSLNF